MSETLKPRTIERANETDIKKMLTNARSLSPEFLPSFYRSEISAVRGQGHGVFKYVLSARTVEPGVQPAHFKLDAISLDSGLDIQSLEKRVEPSRRKLVREGVLEINEKTVIEKEAEFLSRPGSIALAKLLEVNFPGHRVSVKSKK